MLGWRKAIEATLGTLIVFLMLYLSRHSIEIDIASIYHNIRAVLELLYFISGIILMITAFVALKQLKIAKEDIELAKQNIELAKEESKLRSKREAISLTATVCSDFKDVIANQIRNRVALKGINLTLYTGSIDSDFTFNNDCTIWYTTLSNDPKNKPVLDEINVEIVKFLNDLEAFAFYFTSGVCDEQIAFSSHALVFCQFVKDYYPVIARERTANHLGYQPIVELYSIWSIRLEKIKIEREAAAAEKVVQNLRQVAASKTDSSISPIGT